MTTLTLTLTTLGLRDLGGAVPDAGSVDYDRIATLSGRQDRDIRCTSGHLWVTVENDPNDIVLDPGDCLHVSGRSKVVIGGKGTYRLSMPMALAS